MANHSNREKSVMLKVTATVLSLLFLLATNSSFGQNSPEPIFQKILPGDPTLSSERMAPHHVRYRKFGGSMQYDVELVELNDAEVFRVNVDINQNDSLPPDSMYFDTETLEYVGRYLELSNYTIDVRVSGGHFSGLLIPADGSDMTPVVYDKNYPHGAFEPAIINYFISALPLAEGYTASIPVFDLNNGSQMLWSNIEVLGKEVLRIKGREYETWKVQSDGIRQKTIWVSTTEPYAIRMKTKGMFGTWEISP